MYTSNSEELFYKIKHQLLPFQEQSSLSDFTTPKIDEILQMFKQRKSESSKLNNVNDNRSQAISGTDAMIERLGALEEQITSLLQLQMKKQV